MRYVIKFHFIIEILLEMRFNFDTSLFRYFLLYGQKYNKD